MECFVKASGYQGEPEPIVINGVVVPGFEIFQDILGKKLVVEGVVEKWEEELMSLETLTLDEEEKAEKNPIMKGEMSIDDDDICLPDLFECISKFFWQ